MNKKVILLSTLVMTGIIALTQLAYAANANISFLPATGSSNIGKTFSLSVQMDPQGNKVCVVKGTLNFTNLTCENITVASGLISQTTPTCASPNFTLGIPKCIIDLQNLMTVSALGSSVSQAKVSISGIDVIGAGTIVASTVNDGTYDIVAIPVPVTTPASAPAKIVQNVKKPTEGQVSAVQPIQDNNTTANPGLAALPTNNAGKLFGNSNIITVIIVVCLAALAWWAYKKYNKKEEK